MTRSIALAEETRATYTTLVAEHLSKLFLQAHELSLTDDAAMAAAASQWLSDKKYEQLDTKLDTLSTYCRQLRESIEASLVELNVLRSGVMDAVEAASAEQKGDHSPTVVDVSAIDEKDDDVEGNVDRGMEAMFAAGGCEKKKIVVASPENAQDEEQSQHSMLRFIVEMGKPGTVTSYTPTQVLQMLNKCEAMLEDLPPKVQHDTQWVAQAPVEGKPPSTAVNEMVAAFIYSVDAKDCDCRTVKQCLQRQLEDSVSAKNHKHRRNPVEPSDHTALGWNGNHWAMMNWADRVAADPALSCSPATEQKIHDAVQFFAPLRFALNAGLKTFPTKPRVVFRGITVPVAHKYKLGTEVVFAPFTSTSLEGNEALKFMKKGGTYFVINTHSGGLIADFSHYPEQAEALLSTHSEFVVTSKMSRTLQQMLDNDFDVVFMSEKNSRLSPKDTIAQLVEGNRTTEFVYADYTKKYVEGRVSTHAPPLSDEKNNETPCVPLYKAATHFVNGSSLPFMLLLGAGGAGKTSALVGCLCHLMRLKTRHSRPLLPLFVSLPSVGPLLHEPRGLDRHLQQQLRLDDETFQLMQTEARVVLLLDSLDEVAAEPSSNASILVTKLLDVNPWSGAAKVIVSTRTEFIDAAADASYETVLSADSNKTQVYHVWPFNDADRQTFMRQAASDRIEELARREAAAQYARLRDTFQLTDNQLSHPCVLHIATKVLAQLGDGANKTGHNLYTLYDNFIRGALSSLATEDVELVMKELRHVAHSMASDNVWHIPVQEIRQRLSSLNINCDDLLSLIPSRCEDLHNPNSLWSFWHKTVAEFLAAQALKLESQPTTTTTHNHQQGAGVEAMLQLGAKVDEYVFVPNPPNIREVLEEQLSQGRVKHIDMRAVVVDDATTSVDDWVRKHLLNLQCKPLAQHLKLSLPVFPNVTTLRSFSLGDGKKVWEKAKLNIRQSLPSVVTIKDNFEISGCHNIEWPFFPLVKSIPKCFQSESMFPSPILFPNVEHIEEGNNFDKSSPNGGLQPSSFPKVARMPRKILLDNAGAVDLTQLPPHWLSTFVVPDNMSMEEFGVLVEDQRPTTIDFRACNHIDSERTLLWFVQHVDYPALVLPPRWSSPPPPSCFSSPKPIEFKLALGGNQRKLQLDMTDCFSEYETLEIIEVQCSTLKHPRLRGLQRVRKSEHGPSRINAERVDFHEDTFSEIKHLHSHFIAFTAKEVVLPRFSSVRKIDNECFRAANRAQIQFGNDSFPECTEIGYHIFTTEVYGTCEFVNIPAFKKVREVKGRFLADCRQQRLELPPNFLCSCRSVTRTLFMNINVIELVLPPDGIFLPAVETIDEDGEYFSDVNRIKKVTNFNEGHFVPKCANTFKASYDHGGAKNFFFGAVKGIVSSQAEQQ